MEEGSGESSTGIWCKNCGQQLIEEYTRCPRCGRRIDHPFLDDIQPSRDYCTLAAGLLLLSALMTLFFVLYHRWWFDNHGFMSYTYLAAGLASLACAAVTFYRKSYGVAVGLAVVGALGVSTPISVVGLVLVALSGDNFGRKAVLNLHSARVSAPRGDEDV